MTCPVDLSSSASAGTCSDTATGSSSDSSDAHPVRQEDDGVRSTDATVDILQVEDEAMAEDSVFGRALRLALKDALPIVRSDLNLSLGVAACAVRRD